MAIGADCGTYNLICCAKDKDNELIYNREVNAFIEIPLDDEERYVYNIMDKAGVALIEIDNVAYAMGEAATKMAATLSKLELKRPMKDGCVNPKEKSAFDIMKIMIHSLLEECVTKDQEVLYYSVPANALNEETDADYHSKILEAIFKAYESEEGFKVLAHPINEALALIYAELSHKNYTGISASMGAGMINICFAMFGAPIYQFSIVNSGDWIDKMASKATGESIAFINRQKTKVDLIETPKTLVDRAIQTQYKLMIEKTITNIKKGISEAGKKVRSDDPIDIVIAGGTSMAKGFISLFKEILLEAKLPIEIGEIIYPSDPLHSVARGCLVAAENSRKG